MKTILSLGLSAILVFCFLTTFTADAVYAGGKKLRQPCNCSDNGWSRDEQGKPHGLWKFHEEGGRLSSEMEFLHGKRHGVFKRFGKDSKVIESGKFENDSPSGLWQAWRFDGSKYFEAQIGKTCTRWKLYNTAGKESSKDEYCKNESASSPAPFPGERSKCALPWLHYIKKNYDKAEGLNLDMLYDLKQQKLIIGENKEEALLISSNGFCGTGGCSWELFLMNGPACAYPVPGDFFGSFVSQEMPAVHKGFRDLLFYSRCGALIGNYTRYRFDGNGYKPFERRECQNIDEKESCQPWITIEP